LKFLYQAVSQEAISLSSAVSCFDKSFIFCWGVIFVSMLNYCSTLEI
jgi:hypothetical protein